MTFINMLLIFNINYCAVLHCHLKDKLQDILFSGCLQQCYLLKYIKLQRKTIKRRQLYNVIKNIF